MAYPAQNQQSFTLLALVKNITKFLQILSMFYAFFSLVYWLLYTSGLTAIEGVFWIFKPTWDFVNLFYTYKPALDNQVVDFTGVISSICLIILSNTFKSIGDVVSTAEINYHIKKSKKQASKVKHSVKNTIQSPKKSFKDQTNFVFILDVQISPVSNFIQEENMSAEAIDSLKHRFYEALLNNLNHNQISQKGYFRKKLYLIYKDFDYVDNFIFYTRETLNSLSKEFAKPTIRIDFLVGLGSLSFNDDFSNEINILDTIICLNLKNEFVTTSGFKSTYETRTKSQYRLITKGIYNLSKNLNVANNQEIFSLRELI